jgi:hypothetical protein
LETLGISVGERGVLEYFLSLVMSGELLIRLYMILIVDGEE